MTGRMCGLRVKFCLSSPEPFTLLPPAAQRLALVTTIPLRPGEPLFVPKQQKAAHGRGRTADFCIRYPHKYNTLPLSYAGNRQKVRSIQHQPYATQRAQAMPSGNSGTLLPFESGCRSSHGRLYMQSNRVATQVVAAPLSPPHSLPSRTSSRPSSPAPLHA